MLSSQAIRRGQHSAALLRVRGWGCPQDATELVATLRTVSDHELVRNTIARNNQALDDRRYDDCVATYAPDGRIAAPGTRRSASSSRARV
jgi:hypothetical protein